MWKRTKIWEKICFVLLLAAGILFLCRGEKQVQAFEEYSGNLMEIQTDALTAGVYEVRFSASAAVEGTGMVEATDTTGRFLSVCANSTEFFTEEGEQKISFYVNGRKQPVLIRFSYTGAGEAQIREISLVRTRAGEGILFVSLLTCFLLAEGVAHLRRKWMNLPDTAENRQWKKGWIVAIIMVFTASFPLLTDYVLMGERTAYYMTWIEALAKGNTASLGEYCTLLVIPAFFRWVGFPAGLCLKGYILFLNLLTAGLACWGLGQVVKRKDVALFVALLYTLSPYRLSALYEQGALEKIAWIGLFPLFIGTIGFIKKAWSGRVGTEKKEPAKEVLEKEGLVREDPVKEEFVKEELTKKELTKKESRSERKLLYLVLWGTPVVYALYQVGQFLLTGENIQRIYTVQQTEAFAAGHALERAVLFAGVCMALCLLRFFAYFFRKRHINSRFY